MFEFMEDFLEHHREKWVWYLATFIAGFVIGYMTGFVANNPNMLGIGVVSGFGAALLFLIGFEAGRHRGR